MKVFLAAPYMLFFSTESGVEPVFRDRINGVLATIQKKNVTVLSAYARENWVADLDEPEDAVNYDFRAIEEADFLIAFIGDKTPSNGVLMEVGFAAAHKKRICIFYKKNLKPFPFLARGLNTWTDTELVEYKNDADAYKKLDKLLEKELGAANYISSIA